MRRMGTQEQTFIRQIGLLNPESLQDLEANVVGCGAVGSWIALILLKMGMPKVRVLDPDKVEALNLPSQLYGITTVGIPKVIAWQSLAQSLRPSGDQQIEGIIGCVTAKSAKELQSIVVLAVDSMRARSQIFRGIRFRPSVRLLVDCRMGGETGRIYTIEPYREDDVRYYEQSLYSDTEAFADGECSRSIAYTAAFIASLAALQIRRALTGQGYATRIIVDLQGLRLIPDRIRKEV